VFYQKDRHRSNFESILKTQKLYSNIKIKYTKVNLYAERTLAISITQHALAKKNPAHQAGKIIRNQEAKQIIFLKKVVKTV
jgi:hypothetical protein